MRAGRVVGFLAGIRGRMTALLMAAGVPVLVIAATNAMQGREATFEEASRRLATQRELVLVQAAAKVDGMSAMLQSLSRIDLPGRGDSESCANELRRVLDLYPGRYANLWISDGQHDRICSAVPEASTAMPPRDRINAALSSGLPAFGDIIPADGDQHARLPFALALSRPSGQPRVLVGGTLLLSSFLRPGLYPVPGQFSWLVDGQGEVVPLQGGEVNLAPRDLSVLRPADSVVQATARNGAEMSYAIAPFGPGLRIVVGQAYEPVRATAWSTLLQRLAELSAFLLACLVAIVVGADLGLVRPLHSLTERVKRWRPGMVFEKAPNGIEPREVIELEQAFDEATRALAAREADLVDALDQRDALMAEIHHRVKNNLQIVSSLLNLQANRIRDPKVQAEFRAARDRVRAIATLHRYLYVQQSFEAIALRPFLEELATQQFSSQGEVAGERLRLRIEAEGDLRISTDQAVTVALFVTEAVSNAVTHAFPGEATGTITVRVTQEGPDVILDVQDDGIGLPGSEAAPRGLGLGLQLLDGFARQLGGRLLREDGPGTCWRVRFPLRERAAPARNPGDRPRRAA